MTGILRYGAYLPHHRLARSEIAAAWGSRGEKGERTVANHDEDSITLAVEACRDCLWDEDLSRIDGLFFVSTTSPYREKQAAGFIAAVLGLKSDLMTADFSHSLRTGLTAMELALAYAGSGRAQTILVVFVDTRVAYPGSPLEPLLGDAAAAFLVGSGDAAATRLSYSSTANEMMDIWRTDDDRFLQSWEDRWVKQHGVLDLVLASAGRTLQQAGLKPSQVQRAVLPAPDSRTLRQLARSLRLEDGQLADSLLDRVGFSGAAHVPLLLALALETAGPDEHILVSAYGDGAESVVLRTTEHANRAKGRRSVSGWLTRRRALPNYHRYLWHRHLLEVQPPPELLVGSSATVLWRERKGLYQLLGSRCRQCGSADYPIERICPRCQSKDDYEEIPLADCRGKLFTFTLDHLASQMDPPLIQSVVDLEPGCRLYTTMTDAVADEVVLEMDLELTFRRSRKAEGFYNYFWKCRPVR